MKNVMRALAVAVSTAVGVQASESAGTKMEQAPAKAAVNRTKGVVKSLDAATGTVTLEHEPVPALKWPAMTMPFRISPELARGLKAGQKVNVEFEAQGMSATITRIAVAK